MHLQPPAPDDPNYGRYADYPAGAARAGIVAVNPGFIEKSPQCCNAPGPIAACVAMSAMRVVGIGLRLLLALAYLYGCRGD